MGWLSRLAESSMRASDNGNQVPRRSTSCQGGREKKLASTFQAVISFTQLKSSSKRFAGSVAKCLVGLNEKILMANCIFARSNRFCVRISVPDPALGCLHVAFGVCCYDWVSIFANKFGSSPFGREGMSVLSSRICSHIGHSMDCNVSSSPSSSRSDLASQG
jgi:hypothetical protein